MARARDPLTDQPGREHWQAYARQWRSALQLAMREPDFLKMLQRVGKAEHGEPGGMPDDMLDGAQRTLMKISRAYQAESRR